MIILDKQKKIAQYDSFLKKNTDNLTKYIAKKEFYENRKNEVEEKIKKLSVEDLEECVIVLQKMSAFKRESARNRLEELGTMALQYSLGPDYRMIIDIPETKKKPTAEVYVLHLPTLLKTNPESENGGGVVDILSFAMRFVVLQSIDDPVIDGPIIMDEPFKMVSAEYVPMLIDFIKKIAEDFDRQVIVVTHNNDLAQTSRIISVSSENGESIVEVNED